MALPPRHAAAAGRIGAAALVALALAGRVAGATNSWATAEESAALAREMQDFFRGAEVRSPGAAGNLAAEQKVADAFAATGFRHGEIRFRAPRFIPGAAELAVEGQAPIRLLAMHPTLLRPGNFAESNFTASLVYLGRGRVEDLEAASGRGLSGAIAVMEFDCQADWIAALRFGVKGFLFLGREGRYYPRESVAKVLSTEVSIPRFFVPPEEAGRLRNTLGRSAGTRTARIRAEPSRWENCGLRDLWVLIPGSDKDLSKEAVLVTAPLDSNGIVPDLATGGQAAANLYLLMRLLARYRQQPPSRTVLLAAVNAHTQHFLGERMLAWNLLVPPAKVEAAQDALARDLRVQEMLVDRYSRINLARDVGAEAPSREESEAALSAAAGARGMLDAAVRFGRRDLRNAPAKAGEIGRAMDALAAAGAAGPAKTAAGTARPRATIGDLSAEERGRLMGWLRAAEDELYLIALRSLVDDSTGRYVALKEPIVNLAKRNVNLIKAAKLSAAAKAPDGRPVESRERDMTNFVSVLTLFNKAGIRTQLSDLTDEQIAILRGYVRELIANNRLWAELNKRDIEAGAANVEIRRATEGRSVKFVTSLEYTWTEPLVGFWSADFWGQELWYHRWGADTAALAARLAPSLYVDGLTKSGGLPPGHFFVENWPGVMAFHAAGRTPAFAARNVYGDAGLAFSPADTLDNLDRATVANVMNFSIALLTDMFNTPVLTAPSELEAPPSRRGWTWEQAWAVQLRTFKFDEFSASVVPELPVPGSMAIVYPFAPPPASYATLPPIVSGDVIGQYFCLTDERAAGTIYGIWERRAYTTAFQLDPSGRSIVHANDAGDVERKIVTSIENDKTSAILPLFECREFPIYARDDSSRIAVTPIEVPQYMVLSGKLNTPPKRYGLSGAGSVLSAKQLPVLHGPLSVFLEPGESLKLLTSGKTLALNASAEFPSGLGFESAEQLGPDFFAAAVHDMARLNRDRLGRLRGVSDELAQQFLKRGDAALEEMERAKAVRRHAGYLKALYVAIGSHAKAYAQTTSITNDMLKAVVFYLALLLPFCFFVQKLVFKFVKIEMEMLMFAVLFVATFLVFRTIHPAFRVAKAPEAIFVAFVMGGLGAFVIKILHSRFEGEMQLLFKTYPGMEAGQAGYSTVGQEAMLIGVNNMKRRRLRTTFTTATIVLVTFTMLAFTSISKRMSPTLVRTAPEAPYTGIMYHWPGKSLMDEATLKVFANTFSDAGTVAVRRWLMPPGGKDQYAPFSVSAPGGARGLVDAVLGLSTNEDGFLAPIPLAAGRFFASDAADEVVLPSAMARTLGIDPDRPEGNSICFQGHVLPVVGVLKDEALRMLKDLNQRSLLPIKAVIRQGGGADEVYSSIAEVDDTAGETGVFYADPGSLLVMPVETARRFGAAPYSLSLRLPSEAAVWPIVDRVLSMTSANKFYVASRSPFPVGENTSNLTGAGVYYIGEGYRTSIGGLTFLLIPLLIAATIILNTMLGSVFERKSEIAVYNAVGLNPTHIGMFFLAESFVYSVIGSVGGYLIGQILSILLTKTGLITEVNLNFSSLSVVYVILFTVAVVLLSTIYPSIVATKAAVPSGKRKWSLPPNDGQTMHVVFPFIYQTDLIRGILGYLESYFSRFTEASFGDLVAVLEKKAAGRDASGQDAYSLTYHVSLTPFDLGVTQRVTFTGAYDERVQAYRVTMNVARLSGQDANWVATNKPFLERLRTYLLHWRNLEHAEHALYVRRGEAVFSGA